jgi:type III secretion system (T3SS) SseB-like protein
VPGLNVVAQEYPEDNGSADPAVVAALAAYAAGRGSETAALAALAGSRLLVPVVTVRAETAPAPQPAGSAPAAKLASDKVAEMALPTVIGADGRAALPAFTCVDALTRWRADARPVPLPAAQVWQAAREEASAAVIDLAGPVPLAVEGARLAALAAGEPPPAPHTDPDVLAVAREALAREQDVITGLRLLPGGPGSDLVLEVRLAPGRDAGEPAVRRAIERTAAGVMAGTGGRFRRGIEVAATTGPPGGAARPPGGGSHGPGGVTGAPGGGAPAGGGRPRGR